jgi:hypothetical protein
MMAAAFSFIQGNWLAVNDGHNLGYSIFKRHYTYHARKDKGSRFVGPGERIVLISKCGKALFVWRKERFRLDEQIGVNCAVFRNEGDVLSSELILEAEKIALQRSGRVGCNAAAVYLFMVWQNRNKCLYIEQKRTER